MGLSDRYPGTMLALGGLLQVAILWTFLTAFYQVYISRVETRALDHQMSDLIRRNVPKALAKADTPAKSLKSLLRSLDLGRVADLYRRPDEAVETSNRWLFVVAWVVAAALFGGVAVLLAVVFGSCGLEGAGPDVLDVVRENVWLFLVVGVVEFLFFQHIAAKFIPAAPSDLVHGLLRRLRGSGSGSGGAGSSREPCRDVWPEPKESSMVVCGSVFGAALLAAVVATCASGHMRKLWGAGIEQID